MIRTGTAAAPSLSLVVPLFDEEDRVAERGPALAAFVAGLPTGSELIFVDDGSTDATVAMAEKVLAAWPHLSGYVITRPHRGKGAAVAAGLAEAQADYAGFCDVDLSTGLDQLEQIFKAATMSRVLAIGSRDVVGSQLVKRQSKLRELLGRAYNRLIQLTLLPGISDTQCGAKVAMTEVWREVLPYCAEEGFAWDVEVVAVARRLGIPVQEIAVEWRHDERTKVRVGRDGMRMVLALGRIWRNTTCVPAVERVPPSASVFDEARASTLIASDTDHWWFRSKAAFVASALRRNGVPADSRLVDVGAGAGGVTTMLGVPPQRLVTLDGSEELCRQARRRHALLTTVAMGQAIPLRDRAAGVVTLLDVIEHLDRPDDVLREARRILDDDGRLVVSVPAHSWLWSAADVYLGHRRRYSRRLLRQHLEGSGFRVLWISHVFSWLVLPVVLVRRLQTDPERQLGLGQKGAVVDAAALVLTRLERAVVRWCPLPLGTSIICLAAKDHRTTTVAVTKAER